MSKSNFTLLTQDEIDTLVDFLVDKKQDIRNEVLSQQSIDKLIRLIQSNDTGRIRMNPVVQEEENTAELLVKLGLCGNQAEKCYLEVRVNEATSYVELYAVNREMSREHKITPDNLVNLNFDDSESEWGYSIVPASFDEVAVTFGLQYDRETLDRVCMIYAEKNYGSREAKVPAAFLPLSNRLLINITE